MQHGGRRGVEMQGGGGCGMGRGAAGAYNEFVERLEFSECDRRAMRRALQLAKRAADGGEVPVGAAVYDDSGVVGEGENRMLRDCDPSAHAEIIALRAAALRHRNYRLPECKIAVTLEPCLMCAGAIFHARLRAVVFAAADAKTGAFGGATAAHQNPLLNHHTAAAGGLLQSEAAALLQAFFRARR